jgi:hypothetical protein
VAWIAPGRDGRRRARHLGDVGRLALHLTYPAPDEASGVIANGYLRLDPQEWIRAVEKRRAALGG